MKIETKTNKDAYLKQNMKEETLKKTSNHHQQHSFLSLKR